MVEIQNIFARCSEGLRKPGAPVRIGIVTAGRTAPGMNSAVRTLIRLGMAAGCEMLGIEEGPEGLIRGKAHRTTWMEPEFWNSSGGSRLGAGRQELQTGDLGRVADNFRQWGLNGLILIGDWGGYLLLSKLIAARKTHPEFRIPLIAIPASINNDLPGCEHSIGCDTALNTILDAIDRVKDSTDTAKRTYVVEVMGRYSGYLAVMAGLASGAEFVYTPEEGITLDMLRCDVRRMSKAFRRENRHTGLIIRSENAADYYTTDFVSALFEAEGGDDFDVRKAVLGPIQQGGPPTPLDRIMAVRYAYSALRAVEEAIRQNDAPAAFVGMEQGAVKLHPWNTVRRYPDPWRRPETRRWWEEYTGWITALSVLPDGMAYSLDDEDQTAEQR